MYREGFDCVTDGTRGRIPRYSLLFTVGNEEIKRSLLCKLHTGTTEGVRGCSYTGSSYAGMNVTRRMVRSISPWMTRNVFMHSGETFFTATLSTTTVISKMAAGVACVCKIREENQLSAPSCYSRITVLVKTLTSSWETCLSVFALS